MEAPLRGGKISLMVRFFLASLVENSSGSRSVSLENMTRGPSNGILDGLGSEGLQRMPGIAPNLAFLEVELSIVGGSPVLACRLSICSSSKSISSHRRSSSMTDCFLLLSK